MKIAPGFAESYGHNEESILDEVVVPQLYLFKYELEAQMINPPAGDVRIGAFCTALSEMLEAEGAPRLHTAGEERVALPDDAAAGETPSPITDAIFALMKDRLRQRIAHNENRKARGLPVSGDSLQESSSYSVNRFLRGLNGLIIKVDHYRPDFIKHLDKIEPWKQLIRLALTPGTSFGETFRHNFVELDTLSNVSERYKGPMMFAAITAGKSRRPVSVLDVGCSQEQGIKKWYLMHHETFSDIRFREVEAAGRLVENEEGDEVFVPDTALTEAANRTIAQGIELGFGVGIDKEDINNPKIRHKAKSDSFYPSEFLDKCLIEAYDLVDTMEPDQIKFVQGDFSDLDKTTLEAITGQQKYDYVVFSLVWYMNSQAERESMIAAAKECLNPGGYILLQDFVHVDKNQLVFEENWFQKPFPYRTYVLANDRWLEAWRWKNGRCTALALGADADKLGLTAALAGAETST